MFILIQSLEYNVAQVLVLNHTELDAAVKEADDIIRARLAEAGIFDDVDCEVNDGKVAGCLMPQWQKAAWAIGMDEVWELWIPQTKIDS